MTESDINQHVLIILCGNINHKIIIFIISVTNNSQ